MRSETAGLGYAARIAPEETAGLGHAARIAPEETAGLGHAVAVQLESRVNLELYHKENLNADKFY